MSDIIFLSTWDLELFVCSMQCNGADIEKLLKGGAGRSCTRWHSPKAATSHVCGPLTSANTANDKHAVRVEFISKVCREGFLG